METGKKNWKPKALKVLNPLIAILFLIQGASGLFSKVIGYQLFSIVHRPCGVLLIVGVIFHVYLNWSWVKASFFRPKTRQDGK